MGRWWAGDNVPEGGTGFKSHDGNRHRMIEALKESIEELRKQGIEWC